MFWSINKKNNCPVRTLIWRPVSITVPWGQNNRQGEDEVYRADVQLAERSAQRDQDVGGVHHAEESGHCQGRSNIYGPGKAK